MKKILIGVLALFLLGCAPESGKEILRKKTELKEIGAFYTEILDTTENRVNNLSLCASVLDGVIVKSGDVFSFNETVGQRTKEKGYEEAAILIGDEKGCAVGGGVCQVSSTLYNAAELSGMEIVERHSHSRDIHYVEEGRDAAISWGSLDFKFKNNKKNNIQIAMKVENGYVYANIYEVTEIG